MRSLVIGLLSLSAVSCAELDASRPPVAVEMQNVDLHMTPDVTLHIHRLSGTAVPAGDRSAPYLDDKTSYRIDVASGEVAIDLTSLNALMTRTLGDGRSNVHNLRVSIETDGTLRQKGTIDKAIDIPFNVKGAIGITPDGKIRVHSESVKGYGVSMKPLMRVFGIEMDDLLHVKPGNGVTVDGNDVILDPSRLLPPPTIQGRLTAVRVEGQTLVQVFGNGVPKPPDPPAAAKNHILFRGGEISFGKLTMNDADLEIVDDDPGDPLDFSVDGWNQQLVAGYAKITARHGLRAHVPDFDDMHSRSGRSGKSSKSSR